MIKKIIGISIYLLVGALAGAVGVISVYRIDLLSSHPNANIEFQEPIVLKHISGEELTLPEGTMARIASVYEDQATVVVEIIMPRHYLEQAASEVATPSAYWVDEI